MYKPLLAFLADLDRRTVEQLLHHCLESSAQEDSTKFTGPAGSKVLSQRYDAKWYQTCHIAGVCIRRIPDSAQVSSAARWSYLRWQGRHRRPLQP